MTHTLVESAKGTIDRPDDLGRVRQFTRLSRIEIEDPIARAESFKNSDPEQILESISSLNGLLCGKSGLRRWIGAVAMKVSDGRSDSEMESPDNAEEAFFDATRQIQAELDVDNEESLVKASVELYAAIVGAHMFADGNGRTARLAFHLLRYGQMPEADMMILDRESSYTGRLCEDLNELATLRVMYCAELPKDRCRLRHFTLLDEDSAAADTLGVQYGLTRHLKYVAAMRVLLESEERQLVFEANPPNHLYLSNLGSNERVAYEAQYSRIKKEWFNAFVDIAGVKYSQYAEMIESSRLNLRVA